VSALDNKNKPATLSKPTDSGEAVDICGRTVKKEESCGGCAGDFLPRGREWANFRSVGKGSELRDSSPSGREHGEERVGEIIV